VAGAELFAQSCNTCHTYLGAGSSNYGAPDLSAIGASRPGRRLLRALRVRPEPVRIRSCRNFGEQLSNEQIDQIAVFLDASKGG
jgi:mono/diheme cytochrome c family protein